MIIQPSWVGNRNEEKRRKLWIINFFTIQEVIYSLARLLARSRAARARIKWENEIWSRSPALLPDRCVHNFSNSKFVDQQILSRSKTSIDGFWIQVLLPGLPIHNFRASKSVDRQTLCVVQTRQSTDYEALNLWNGRSGMLGFGLAGCWNLVRGPFPPADLLRLSGLPSYTTYIELQIKFKYSFLRHQLLKYFFPTLPSQSRSSVGVYPMLRGVRLRVFNRSLLWLDRKSLHVQTGLSCYRHA